MNRKQILDREARGQAVAGWTAVAAAPAMLVATFIRQGSSVPFNGLATEQFRAIDGASGSLLASSALQSVALLLVIPPLLYLFRAAQARSERVSGAMVGFIFIGPILLAVYFIASWAWQSQIASDFVAQSGAGGDVYNLLDDLLNDSTLYQFASSLYIPASIAFVVATFYVALNAQRNGLLTRVSATLGMALAVSTIILPPGMLGLMIWFGWIGFTILDKTPKGRPPAWAAGESIPWLKPGDQPRPAVAAEAPIDGDATEVFEGSSQDHSARRERARKRKRKRRR